MAQQSSSRLRDWPWAATVIVIPSWLFWAAMERDDYDTGNPLYFHIPDLFENPLQVVFSLFITPLVNTETDQVILITVLICTFGVAVERRVGHLSALALFWGASVAGAVLGGLLWHVLYPLFPDFEPIAIGGERVFNGASAGGFAFMAAYAAMSRRPRLWVGLFCIWEPAFWYFVSWDYTSVFHVIAFTTGYATSRFHFIPRMEASGPRLRKPP